MRRADRQMDKTFAREVIDKAIYGNLAINNKEFPQIIPLSIVRDKDKLYFHSAKSGEKVSLFENEKKVVISFVNEVKVPNLYNDLELDEMLKNKENIKLLITSVFTTEFESAIVKGEINLVEDEEEKIHAMKLICMKYAKDKMKYIDTAIEAGLGRTNIYRVDIFYLSAKRKKYDENKEEMKWQRMK